MVKHKYRISYRALRRVCAERDAHREYWIGLAEDLGYAMKLHNIDTRRRATMFIATLAHESVQFKFTEEIASGAAYEWRSDLGNVRAGDGVRYKGRSFIQITGRRNYAALPRWDGIDFEAHPDLLSRRRYACLAAAWWWKNHGLNGKAESRWPGAFLRVTKVVNGGFNGMPDRNKLFRRACRGENRDALIPRREPRP